jgi:hypothetical protein
MRFVFLSWMGGHRATTLRFGEEQRPQYRRPWSVPFVLGLQEHLEVIEHILDVLGK